jgi:hypothetical protein
MCVATGRGRGVCASAMDAGNINANQSNPDNRMLRNARSTNQPSPDDVIPRAFSGCKERNTRNPTDSISIAKLMLYYYNAISSRRRNWRACAPTPKERNNDDRIA